MRVDLSGKTALITGGNKGIGCATAQLLAHCGAKVAISGRDKDGLENIKKMLAPDCLAIQCDVSRLESIDALYQEAQKQFGFLDILFINAGVARRIALEEATEEMFDWMCDINFKGAFFTLQKAVPYLNKQASIIINASLQGVLSVVNKHSIYSCTKAALIQLAKSAAGELADRGIRVNALSPVWVKTPPWNQRDQLVRQLSAEIPLERRFTTAEEVASAVLFLASPLSSHMTGQNLIIDGGVSTILQHPNIAELN